MSYISYLREVTKKNIKVLPGGVLPLTILDRISDTLDPTRVLGIWSINNYDQVRLVFGKENVHKWYPGKYKYISDNAYFGLQHWPSLTSIGLLSYLAKEKQETITYNKQTVTRTVKITQLVVYSTTADFDSIDDSMSEHWTSYTLPADELIIQALNDRKAQREYDYIDREVAELFSEYAEPLEYRGESYSVIMLEPDEIRARYYEHYTREQIPCYATTLEELEHDPNTLLDPNALLDLTEEDIAYLEEEKETFRKAEPPYPEDNLPTYPAYHQIQHLDGRERSEIMKRIEEEKAETIEAAYIKAGQNRIKAKEKYRQKALEKGAKKQEAIRAKAAKELQDAEEAATLAAETAEKAKKDAEKALQKLESIRQKQQSGNQP